MNLLKFPIINPTPHRMFRRLERLKADKSQSEDDLIEEELKNLQLLKKHGYLIGKDFSLLKYLRQLDNSGLLDVQECIASRYILVIHTEWKQAFWPNIPTSTPDLPTPTIRYLFLQGTT